MSKTPDYLRFNGEIFGLSSTDQKLSGGAGAVAGIISTVLYYKYIDSQFCRTTPTGEVIEAPVMHAEIRPSNTYCPPGAEHAKFWGGILVLEAPIVAVAAMTGFVQRRQRKEKTTT